MKLFSGILICLLLATGCRSSGECDSIQTGPGCEYARYFGIIPSSTFADYDIVTVSPYDGVRDTLVVRSPLKRIVCLSTSHLAAMSAIEADSLVVAMSGLNYVTDQTIRERISSEVNPIYDIGYEASLDYEKIIKLKPDLIVTYMVGNVVPSYISKLESLGQRVLVLYDHLEHHPLARAEYVKLFGALTGRIDIADDFFSDVRDNYLSLRIEEPITPKKVLLNIPFADAWYIPGSENYMSQLIRDAGGVVLGAESGKSESGMITIEDAYLLSMCADVWLNPGYCRTRTSLSSLHGLFPDFGPLAKHLPIFNNVLKVNPEGGNDFWESGSMRPDMILQDLIAILNGTGDSIYTRNYNYYIGLPPSAGSSTSKRASTEASEATKTSAGTSTE